MPGWKAYVGLFKDAFLEFRENHPIKFASAIGYFSLFALPCIFLITITILRLFFKDDVLYAGLQKQLEKVIDDDGAGILVTVTRNYQEQASESVFTMLIYTVVVFWLSTQLFRLLQNSLNDLWKIKPDFGFLRKLYHERVVTFAMVLLTGLLFFVNTAIGDALRYIGTGSFEQTVDGGTLASVIVEIITVIVVVIWFALLYKVLPAARIKWSGAIIGAFLTTALFYLGVLLLWHGVVQRDLEDFYDVTASIVMVGLWMFYTSLVFLYSASFTKALVTMQRDTIEPATGAYKYKEVREESEQ